jgi:HEAT repeat protein
MPRPWTSTTFTTKLAEFARAPTPRAAHALAAHGTEEALPALITASRDYMEGPEAVEFRAAMRTLATPALLSRWIADVDVARRRLAAHCLSARYKDHVPMIATALRDTDAEVRAIARRSLTAWTRSEALHGLMRALVTHDDARVRAIAAEALATLGDRRDARSLADALTHEADERTRHVIERAVAALSQA